VRRAWNTLRSMISAPVSRTSHAADPGDLLQPHGRCGDADEQALIRALRARDEDAFARLVRRHQRAMLRVASNYVADRTVAEEVVQETWLAVVSQVGAFEGRSTLKTWIFRILVNQAQRRGGREHRIVPFSSLGREDGGWSIDAVPANAVHWESPARPWLDPQRRVASLEARTTLRAALQALPVRQQAVVALRDVEGFDADEVARALGLSAGNQRVLLHRARARLSASLEGLRDGPRPVLA